MFLNALAIYIIFEYTPWSQKQINFIKKLWRNLNLRVKKHCYALGQLAPVPLQKYERLFRQIKSRTRVGQKQDSSYRHKAWKKQTKKQTIRQTIAEPAMHTFLNAHST